MSFYLKKTIFITFCFREISTNIKSDAMIKPIIIF